MKYIVLLSCLIFSCNKTQTITKLNDYEAYLKPVSTTKTAKLLTNNTFWKEKVKSDTTQSIYYSKWAQTEGLLFEHFGEISHLKKANIALEKAVEITDSTEVGLLHQLAQNYIQQHQFKACIPLLEKAEDIQYKLKTTYQLFFDIHLELGHLDIAESYLERFKNFEDFNYLIRTAKLKDAQGQLDDAIAHLEIAAEKAKLSNNKHLQIWSQSNLGDFYGHQGALKKSYQAYLNTLQLDPSNNYALKGIAWLAFSAEKNTTKANQILDTLLSRAPKPDYFLFKSKLAHFENKIEQQSNYEEFFVNEVSQSSYGVMYNTHLIALYLNSKKLYDPKEALRLAKKEVQHVRATPMAQSWYARALSANNKVKEATHIIKNKVLGHTEEPIALLNAAIVLKESNQNDADTEVLKQQLLEAFYELGPTYQKTIEAL